MTADEARDQVRSRYPAAYVTQASDGKCEVWQGVQLGSSTTTDEFIAWGESPADAWLRAARSGV